MKIVRIIAIILIMTALAIAALWIWICFNPGVIYCHEGWLYMSGLSGSLPVL